MQEAQENYHAKRAFAAKNCGHMMEHTNMKWEERQKIDATSQIEFDLNAPIKCMNLVANQILLKNAEKSFLSYFPLFTIWIMMKDWKVATIYACSI